MASAVGRHLICSGPIGQTQGLNGYESAISRQVYQVPVPENRDVLNKWIILPVTRLSRPQTHFWNWVIGPSFQVMLCR